ncbi:GNAT family N-acetyltransferase [Bdellovibrio sp. HCB337]|uniref:GNAT family N-acetyltransferase n=1 Tax=Bdellovibrio sp. HCB337 TaxID=3394358 RepID=UPI0039A65853
MSWEFIQANSDQAKEISDLINSAYRGESSKKGWTTEADLLGGQRCDVDSIRGLINNDNAVILLAENEHSGNIEGCVHLEKDGDKCYLGMLTVKPTLQSKGLGSMIVEEAEAFADFWDCKTIYMTVIGQRTELITWYEDRGYKNTGEKKPFPYGDERFGVPKVQDLYFVVLEKTLGQ